MIRNYLNRIRTIIRINSSNIQYNYRILPNIISIYITTHNLNPIISINQSIHESIFQRILR